MNNKKQKTGKLALNQKVVPKKPTHHPSVKEIPPPSTPAWQHGLFILLIALVTFICFRPAADNQFLKTWDDQVYVTNNKLIQGPTAKNISEIFSFHKDLQKLTKNYHPLTTLSLAINYQFSGLNPRSYYLTNIFIHILNSILVYLLIFRLTDRKIWAAFFAGLLFGIHPMHVESVAWISERKDVLYGLFFISGMILYYHYLKKKRIKFLVFAFLLFCLSVLSKAMAVVFPLVMVLMDLLLERKWSFRALIEKIPFFVISLFFGLLAIKIQAEGAIGAWRIFTLMQRIMHASYGILSYLTNFFLPVNLSAFYPYPFIDEQGFLPLSFRLAPVVVILILAVSAVALFMKNRMLKVIGFGTWFFILTLVLVLQFISVGQAIIADRYAYIPYIGICFIIGSWGAFLVGQKQPKFRIPGIVLAGFMAVLLVFSAIQTHHRSSVWHDDFALWTDALDQCSDARMNIIRTKCAQLRLESGDYQEAFKEYQAIALSDPKEHDALERIGQIYGQYYHLIDSSLAYLNKANQMNPGDPWLLKNLGVAYAMKADYQKSLECFLAAYKQLPEDTSLMQNLSISYRAIGDITRSDEFAHLAHQKK
ncbi:MAG: hypothetical protein WCO44_03620 [Bacteroidota bacterium]